MGEVALVTGAGVRIGRAIAMALAREGYAVALHARHSIADAEALGREIEGAGGRAAVVTGELADIEAVRALLPTAADALGPVTLLVNSASLFEEDAADRLDAALWDRHFAVNLRAPVFLAGALAAGLPPGAEGAVVNLIDQRVWKLTPQFVSYTLAKSALLTATKTLAQALAPRVRVNAVGPGPTLKSERQAPEDFARQSEALPLGRGASPEEVAEAVLYLARARSVTGQMLALDGGQHLAWRTPDVEGIRE